MGMRPTHRNENQGVTPEQAGVHVRGELDSRFRGNDVTFDGAEGSMSISNPVWSRRIIRAMGILSILFAVFGGFFAVTGAARVFPRLHDSPAKAYERELYCAMTLVDPCCLITLTVGGVCLGSGERDCQSATLSSQ
jgi:hypothetical protein